MGMCSLLRALDMHMMCAQSGLAASAKWSSFSFSCPIGKSHSAPHCPPLLCQEPAIALHSLPKNAILKGVQLPGVGKQLSMSCRGLVLLLPLKWDTSCKFFVVVFVLFSFGFGFFFLVRTGMCSFSEIFKIRVRGRGRIPEFILMAHDIPLKIGEQIWKALCLNATGAQA